MARGDVFQHGTRPTWYAWRFDPERRAWVRRATGMKGKRAALAVAAKWLEQGERLASGATDLVEELEESDIRDHVEAFIASRRTSPKQPTGRHLREVEHRLDRVITAAGWKRLKDITEDGLQSALVSIGSDEEGTMKFTNATLNAYRSAWKALTKWAHRTGRMSADPLNSMPRWMVDGFRSFQRRALSHDEFRRLYRATLDGGATVAGISPEDRAMLYLVAVQTGLRLGELASLTPSSFRLTAQPPVVVVAARRTKNKKDAHQPIPPDMVDRVARWLAGREPTAPLWRLPESMAEVVAGDLEAAGIPIRDQAGAVFDFHSFRHTFGTWLALAGVSPQMAQRLMRHSTMDLTLRYYTHLSAGDLAAAQAGAMAHLSEGGGVSVSGAAPAEYTRVAGGAQDVPADEGVGAAAPGADSRDDTPCDGRGVGSGPAATGDGAETPGAVSAGATVTDHPMDADSGSVEGEEISSMRSTESTDMCAASCPVAPPDEAKEGVRGAAPDDRNPLESPEDAPSGAASEGDAPSDEGNAPSRTRTLNPLIKSALRTDYQSATTERVTGTGVDGAAVGVQDGAPTSDDDSSDDDPDQRRPDLRAKRGAPGHARERADAGETADPEWAFDAMRRLHALALANGGVS